MGISFAVRCDSCDGVLPSDATPSPSLAVWVRAEHMAHHPGHRVSISSEIEEVAS